MKSVINFCCLMLILIIGQTQAADCDQVTNPDDGDFKNFFRSFSCKVKQGASEVADAAKPYTDAIGEKAKDFGSSVAHKYDDIKHRLTDDTSSPTSTLAVQYDGPTERVPLAPIAPSLPSEILANPQPTDK